MQSTRRDGADTACQRIGCHTADYDEPWYEQTDEETFRPRAGTLPADPSEGMLLVRAMIELRDGSRRSGFVTPSFEENDLPAQQPHVFAAGRLFGFWGGMFGVPAEERRALYAALGKDAEAVFPLKFGAEAGLVRGVANGIVEGFYRSEGDTVEMER